MVFWKMLFPLQVFLNVTVAFVVVVFLCDHVPVDQTAQGQFRKMLFPFMKLPVLTDRMFSELSEHFEVFGGEFKPLFLVFIESWVI